MLNTILYITNNQEQVHQCAYSLLKYLSVYNLKPPSDHRVLIHTSDQAMLETYASFFHRFELKDPVGVVMSAEEIRNLAGPETGNVLFLGSNAYPIQPLESLFESISNGNIFAGKKIPGANGNKSSEYSLLGFNTLSKANITATTQQYPTNYIAQYSNLKEFNELLGYFFNRYQEESVPNLVKLVQGIDAKKIEEQRNSFLRLPLYKRLFQKITGKAWKISRYTSKI